MIDYIKNILTKTINYIKELVKTIYNWIAHKINK